MVPTFYVENGLWIYENCVAQFLTTSYGASY